MINPELEKKFKEIRDKKKEMLRDFTRKAVDAVNASEQVSQTFLSMHDSNCAVEMKTTKKLKKKDPTKEAAEEEEIGKTPEAPTSETPPAPDSQAI